LPINNRSFEIKHLILDQRDYRGSSSSFQKSFNAGFKHGDDLRQDQLILQIITLMDKLLQQENLDLKLSPYKVLATSSKHG